MDTEKVSLDVDKEIEVYVRELRDRFDIELPKKAKPEVFIVDRFVEPRLHDCWAFYDPVKRTIYIRESLSLDEQKKALYHELGHHWSEYEVYQRKCLIHTLNEGTVEFLARALKPGLIESYESEIIGIGCLITIIGAKKFFECWQLGFYYDSPGLTVLGYYLREEGYKWTAERIEGAKPFYNGEYHIHALIYDEEQYNELDMGEETRPWELEDLVNFERRWEELNAEEA